MARIMIDVGALVARQIDRYAHSKQNSYPQGKLENVITNGIGHIGRLLHYFPF